MHTTYRSFNPSYLEALATKSLAEKGRYLDFGKLAVDIELMLEMQKFRVCFVDNLPQRIEAFLASDLSTIYVREYLDDMTRQRFSLAEEQAHILIHLPEILRLGGTHPDKYVQCLSQREYKLFEKDARYLAGALLMEATLFHKRFRIHWEENEQQAVRWSRTSPHTQARLTLKKCARDFGVGITCATTRALKLGLIQKEVLDTISS
jgi:Zn-dependent peptidase ImmA (M78 family)